MQVERHGFTLREPVPVCQAFVSVDCQAALRPRTRYAAMQYSGTRE